VRARFGAIPLMVDANAAYTLGDADHLAQLDRFDLMMIEQPLDYDDIADHAALQRRLTTPICLDESIKTVGIAREAIAAGACRIINIKPGRVGGFSEVDPAARSLRVARAFRCGTAACWNPASAAPRTCTCRPCRTSPCPATSRRANAISIPT
jgi:L-alanine-DL-glutamate epimerase-like enolase superfamily enzyme